MGELAPFILVSVAAGYLLRKSGLVAASAARDLSQVVFYVTLPPLIFLALQRGTLSWSLLAMPAVAWALAAVGLGISFAAARLLALDRPRTGAFVLATTFGNTTFFGYPVITALYGEGHLTLAIFYDLLGATIAANLLGVAVAARTGGGQLGLRQVLWRLARFPPIWALGLGLLFHGAPLPAWATDLMEKLGALTVPLIMLSIGLSLQFRHWRQDLGLVSLAAVGRLVVLPALVFAGTWAVGLPEAYRQTAVLQAAMPTMLYTFTLALLFGLESVLVVNTIMVTTLLSFGTLLVWRHLLGG